MEPQKPKQDNKREVPPKPAINQAQLDYYLQNLRSNQNVGLGLLGGVAAAIIGASIWAAITYFTDYQIGFMAIGVGYMTGYAVRLLGKGIDQTFGVIGGATALFGCLLGNLLTACAYIAEAEQVTFWEVLAALDLDVVFEIMKVGFSLMDLLFYALAIYFGYRVSLMPLDPEEIQQAIAKPQG